MSYKEQDKPADALLEAIQQLQVRTHGAPFNPKELLKEATKVIKERIQAR